MFEHDNFVRTFLLSLTQIEAIKSKGSSLLKNLVKF